MFTPMFSSVFTPMLTPMFKTMFKPMCTPMFTHLGVEGFRPIKTMQKAWSKYVFCYVW